VSKRSERIWRGFAVAAAFFYLVAMFAPWRSGCYSSKSWLRALAETVTGACGGWWSVLGITSLVLCYLILVFTLLGPRQSALSLEPLRTVLALTLLTVTVLDIFWNFWRLTGWNESAFIWRLVPTGGVGYGTWVALGASLALLLTFSVLDASGLGKLLDRLPAWARLDRLETPEEVARKAGKPVGSPAERSHRRWTGVLVLALILYVLSLFMNWWSYSVEGTGHLDGFAGIGEFCALAALATLVVARLARSEREHRLECLRNVLVVFLIGVTLVNVLVVWRQTYELLFPYKRPTTHSRPDYGALVTLASILLMLLATLVLNAGSWTKLRKRLPAWTRLARPDEPPGQSEETALLSERIRKDRAR
jgi:hypothetical protein